MRITLNGILAIFGAVQSIYEIGKGVVKVVKKDKKKAPESVEDAEAK